VAVIDVYAETYGFKVGIGTDFTNGNGTYVRAYNAYGWYNFLSGVINVKGGLIDDAVWNTMGSKDWNLSNGLGVRLEVSPLEGLNIGVFLNPGTNDFSAVTAEQFFKETGIGASYKSDLFDIALAFKLDSDADGFASPDEMWATKVPGASTADQDKEWGYYKWIAEESGIDIATLYNSINGVGSAASEADVYQAIYGTAPGTAPDNDISSEMVFGFAFKGVPNLGAKVEAHAWNLGDFSETGFLWLIEDVSYQVLEPLNVGAEFTEYLWGDSDIKPFFQIKPYASYQVNEPISVGLEVPVAFQKDVIKFKLGGKPWVKYAFSDNAYIKAFYNLTYTKPDFPAPFDEAATDHAIQLDFVLSF
jgi:hypothetical protein